MSIKRKKSIFEKSISFSVFAVTLLAGIGLGMSIYGWTQVRADETVWDIRDGDGNFYDRYVIALNSKRNCDPNIPPKGAVLLAGKNLNQRQTPANAVEYTIASFDPETGRQQKLSTLRQHTLFTFWGHNGLSGSKVFYVNTSGKLTFWDFEKDTRGIIDVTNIIPSTGIDAGSLNNYKVDGDKVFYLKGKCLAGSSCSLGMYDVANPEKSLVINGIMDTVVASGNDSVEIGKFDSVKNTLGLKIFGKTGATSTVSSYQVSFSSMTVGTSTEAQYVDCEVQGRKCTKKENADNKQFEKIVAEDTLLCRDTAVSAGLNGTEDTIISYGGKDTVFRGIQYIGCVDYR
jgi:hypothetical protein